MTDPAIPTSIGAAIIAAGNIVATLLSHDARKEALAELARKVGEIPEIREALDALEKRVDEGFAKVNARLDRRANPTGSHPSIDPGLRDDLHAQQRRIDGFERDVAAVRAAHDALAQSVSREASDRTREFQALDRSVVALLTRMDMMLGSSRGGGGHGRG